MSKTIIEKFKAAALPELEKLSEEVKRERDDLKLQLHLMSAEAKDEWAEIEETFKQFARRTHDAGVEIEKIGEEGVETVKQVGESIKNTYLELRNRIL